MMKKPVVISIQTEYQTVTESIGMIKDIMLKISVFATTYTNKQTTNLYCTMINGECEIDQNWCDSNCRGHCIGVNNQVVCNCNSPKYKLNKNTGLRDIINLCDKNEIERKQCDNERAQCLETDDDKGYRCQCPEGQALDQGKCRDLCDMALNKVKCETINAMCVYDRNQNSNFRCECSPGFYYSKSDRNCVVAVFKTRTKLQFRNL
jgi:hypothetical protein